MKVRGSSGGAVTERKGLLTRIHLDTSPRDTFVYHFPLTARPQELETLPLHFRKPHIGLPSLP